MRLSAISALVMLCIWNLTPAGAQAGSINLAHLFGVASANATYDGLIPGNAIDADWATSWAAPGHGTPDNPFWLQVDLQKKYQACQIKLVGSHSPDYPGMTNVYNLYTSDDGVNWNLIHSGTLVDSLDPKIYVHTIPLPATHVFQYAKYEVVGGTHWAGLFEMEIWSPDSTSAINSLLVD